MRRQQRKKIIQKRKETAQYRRKRQVGGFLSRYNFAYARRDIVNQAVKSHQE